MGNNLEENQHKAQIINVKPMMINKKSKINQSPKLNKMKIVPIINTLRYYNLHFLNVNNNSKLLKIKDSLMRTENICQIIFKVDIMRTLLNYNWTKNKNIQIMISRVVQ